MNFSSHPAIRTASLLALLGAFGPVAARAVTLTFKELPTQPADGVTRSGVTFGFTVGGNPSTDATYNSGGPGTLTYVNDPVLEGDATGILSLVFDRPTCDLSFGLALLTFGDVNPAAQVSLFDSGNSLIDTVSVSTSSLISLSEGLFSYVNPGSEISRAEVTFNSAASSRFAIDNLSFHNVCVPDSGSLVTELGIVSMLGWVGWRRRQRDAAAG